MISLFCLQVGQTIYKNFPSLDFGNLHFYLEFLIKFFNNKKKSSNILDCKIFDIQKRDHKNIQVEIKEFIKTFF